MNILSSGCIKKTLKKDIIASMLLIAVVFNAFSQNKYHFELFPIASEKMGINGNLSQGRVSDIVEDERGFIWIGTLDGLNRYDGYKIKVFRYQKGDSTSIDNNQINKIINTSDGYLWVLTKTGINKFDPYTEKAELLTLPDTFSERDKINDIALDITQNLWIATTNGLFVYKKNSNIVDRIELDSFFTNALQLEVDYLNNIWIGSHKDYLIKYNYRLKEIKTYNYPDNPKYTDDYIIHDIHEDKEKNIWVAFQNNGAYNHKLPNVFLLKKGSNQIEIFDEYDSLVTNNTNRTYFATVRCFESRENQLFLSAIANGLARIDFKKRTFTYMPEYSEYNWATEIDRNALFFDSNNNLWLGGNGEGVSFLPFYKETFDVVTQKLKKNFILKSVRAFYEYKGDIY